MKGKRMQEILKNVIISSGSLNEAAKDVCEKALTDAKSHLHPLLRQAELERLDQRCEFLKAFKHALEKEVARKIARWLPGVHAVYKYDAPVGTHPECWDNTVHLLVVVPRLLKPVQALGESLDRTLLKHLRRLGWTRFQMSKSMIEIQQVTPREIRYGVSYGAMFLSFYAAPVQVWPLR